MPMNLSPDRRCQLVIIFIMNRVSGFELPAPLAPRVPLGVFWKLITCVLSASQVSHAMLSARTGAYPAGLGLVAAWRRHCVRGPSGGEDDGGWAVAGEKAAALREQARRRS